MKTFKILLFFFFIWSLTTCQKDDETQSEIEFTDANDSVEDLIFEDYGSGVNDFTAVYEKLIAPNNYTHFCQLNSSSYPSDACLPVAYMMGKGLIRNTAVNDEALQPIIQGMQTDSNGTIGTDGYNYIKSDLGASCAYYLTPKEYNAVFDQYYNAIHDGFPLIVLINLKKINNVYYLETETTHIRHFVVLVGVRIESFSTRSGEVLYIDPLSHEREIRRANMSTFIYASKRASAYNISNIIKIGCADDAITQNYFVSTQTPPTLNVPSPNATNVTLPVTFSWQNLGGNAIYRIQVSKSLSNWSTAGFADNANLSLNQNTNSSNTYSWSNAQPNTTYYWSVKTFKDGVSSPYSQPFKFTTANNTPTETRIINLSGNLSFGNVNVGNYSDKTLNISNTGNASLSVSNITVPNGFSVVNGQSFVLSAGQSQNITIRFQPNASGAYSGNVTVTSNATSGNNALALSGTGISNSPVYTCSPNIGVFTSGSQVINASCSTQPNNPGVIKLKVTSITSSEISLRMEKVSGTFSHSGNFYLRQNSVCGTDLIAARPYQIGWNYLDNITIPNNLQVGQSIVLYGLIISATIDRFYAGPITITRTQ